MEERILTFLKETVGEENVTTDLIDMLSYATDASEYTKRPDVAVWPSSTEQVSAIMKMANEEGIAVTPRGAATNLSGLCVPLEGGIVLDMGRMNKILEVSIPDRLAVVQPGVVYMQLDDELAPLGFAFPPDPASGKAATIGGNVATNAGGVKGAKYGTTKDYVMGLEVVLADGRVLRTGSRTQKWVSGFDLVHIFVGSEGTLGIITEITLKLSPRPTETATALATFDKLSDAGRAVTAIMEAGAQPSVLEIVEKNCLRAINQNTDLGLPEVAAILLVETDGATEDQCQTELDKIIGIFKANKALDVRKAASDEEAEALWAARKSAFAVIARINNTVEAEDTTVPISKIADLLDFIDEVSKKYNVAIPTVGHAGDGNMHPHFSWDRTNPEETARVQEAKAELYAKAVELGGTLTGEHGIGKGKAPYMHLEHSEVAMDVMRSLKKMFDPKNILNPGKMALEG
jgi:glycolate oxidase